MELGLSGFTVFRKDRSFDITGKKINGGVLIAVRSDIMARKLNIPEDISEEVWVAIESNNVNKLLCCVYIPPNSCAKSYEAHCSAVERASYEYDGYGFCIAKDYNLSKLTWCNDSLGTRTRGCDRDTSLS